ncbi:MAG TPA: hypothetical protein PKC18_15395, partial [Lacipirellulaceae bacterium]|nr:hypothetical protein [Lacipirellulaceae bacterium]
MDSLRQQVARARRRLWLQLFLGRLAWCWLAALAAATVAVALPKLIALPALPAWWTLAWTGGSL